jgi:hypothetical protein
MEPFLVVSKMKEKLYVGYFHVGYFYRKGLIGVWYCNLRSPVKDTSPGHLRDTEAKPQYKER